MTVVAERRTDGASDHPAASGFRAWTRREIRWVAPSIAAVLNAAVFAVVAPNVNDIFAAVARESAALHGVGLNYWFSWFGGGATPGNYSVVTPYLSALIGAVPLAAIATAAITPLAWLALRGTTHPVAGLWVATFTAALNLWSGRVPFALGSLLSVVTVIFFLRRRTWLATLFAVLTVAASPVSGAFVVIVLAAVFFVRPQWRRACALVVAPILLAAAGVTVLFGQPGPESFTLVQLIQLLVTLIALLFAGSPDWVKATVWLTIIISPFDFLIANGLGDNLQRFAWYCLPAIVVATSTKRVRAVLLAVAIALVFSSKQTGGDVFAGTEQTASPAYYTSLIHELDRLRRPLLGYRLEVVQDGTHTASFTLLDHAMLARGYEYQEDNELNEVLAQPQLDAVEYKLWLDNNAVGYVAISSTLRKAAPEYTLVSEHRPAYLVRVWHDAKWTLYRVANPNPIVSRPVRIVRFSQAKLVLKVPCACTFGVRVRNPDKLKATTTPTGGGSPVTAQLHDDGFGWTTMTTTAAGTYTLSGS